MSLASSMKQTFCFKPVLFSVPENPHSINLKELNVRLFTKGKWTRSVNRYRIEDGLRFIYQQGFPSNSILVITQEYFPQWLSLANRYQPPWKKNGAVVPWNHELRKERNKIDVYLGLEGTGEASIGDKYAGTYPCNSQAMLEHMVIWCSLYFKWCNKMYIQLRRDFFN